MGINSNSALADTLNTKKTLSAVGLDLGQD